MRNKDICIYLFVRDQRNNGDEEIAWGANKALVP